MVHHETHELTAPDGHRIRTQIWRPGQAASAVIQVLHGLGEHADRYGRFAHAAADRGMAVVAHDHRGHGPNAVRIGHFADTGGWKKVTDDVEVVDAAIRNQFGSLPVIVLGHSMGSFIAQFHAMHYGSKLSGMILSASAWSSRAQLYPALILAHVEKFRLGRRGESRLLHKMGFGDFNKPFLPARTEMDWLSRDEAEVDAYVADPLCGGPYSCGLWLDLIGGLLSIGSDHAISRIPSDLPILITGGSRDPVGGERGMGALALRYAQTLHEGLHVRIYADGRHEMLNEINHDEVMGDWLNWVASIAHGGR